MADVDHSQKSSQPNIPESDISTLLRNKYGFKAIRFSPLCGYYDQNVHVLVEDVIGNPHVQSVLPNGYLVKVVNALESQHPEIINAQIDLMTYLHDSGFPCQRSVRSIDGKDLTDYLTTDSDGNQATHKVSVREYLPGQTLTNFALTSKFLYDLGVFVARLNIALDTFHNPLCDGQDHIWSIHNLPQVTNAISAVKDKDTRRLCEDVIEAFDKTVIPVSSDLRRSTLHGDLNDQNLLVSSDADSRENLVITGLIDYGDMNTSYRISDFTNCVAYMLTMEKLNVPRLDVPGHMLAGYTSLIKMDNAEMDVLHVLVASRLVQSVVYGSRELASDPTNTYIGDAVNKSLATLKEVWERPHEPLRSRWDEIVSTYSSGSGANVGL